MTNRRRKLPQYKNFKFKKKIKHPIKKPIPSVFRILTDTIKHIWKHKRIFIGMIVIYLLLNLLFVKGLKSGLDIPAVKDELQHTSQLSGVGLGATLLAVVAGDSNSGLSEVASFYQTLIAIICSLAYIWLFRQTYEAKKTKIKLKQPFYEGMTPVIPFFLQLILVGIHMLPAIIGISVFGIVQVNGLAVNPVEITIWAIFASLLVVFSLYLLSASVLSLIIVTLPDMTPLKAYKVSKKVVEFRRLIIMRKLILYTILLFAILSSLLLLVVMTIPVIAEWLLIILLAITLPIVIGSGYKLYRSLL